MTCQRTGHPSTVQLIARGCMPAPQAKPNPQELHPPSAPPCRGEPAAGSPAPTAFTPAHDASGLLRRSQYVSSRPPRCSWHGRPSFSEALSFVGPSFTATPTLTHAPAEMRRPTGPGPGLSPASTLFLDNGTHHRPTSPTAPVLLQPLVPAAAALPSTRPRLPPAAEEALGVLQPLPGTSRASGPGAPPQTVPGLSMNCRHSVSPAQSLTPPLPPSALRSH